MAATLLICASMLIVAGVILLVCACIDLSRMGWWRDD